MKSGSPKINGMPYGRRSTYARGRSVSTIGMLALLLAALLVLPSCFDDDDETVTETVKETVTETVTQTVEAEPGYDEIGPGHEVGKENCYQDGDRDGMIAGTEMGDCIEGEEGNDSIKGMGGDDMLDGGPGNDTLYGGADNDELIGGPGNNTLDGGPDTDIAVYKNAMRAVVNLGKNIARVKHSEPEDPLAEMADSGVGTDTLMNIENVKGTHGDDTIDGDGNANLLKGLDGADMINGHGKDDTILPNRPAMDMNGDGILDSNTADGNPNDPVTPDGLDVVDGGEGNDTISYEGEASGEAVTVDLSTVVPAIADDPTTPGNEARIAHVAAQVGTQTVGDESTLGDTDRIKVTGTGMDDDPYVSTIENVTGGFGNDVLTGDTRANILTGGAGGDTLRGEADTVTEMGGDDTLNGGAGADMLYGGPGNDTLNGGDDNDETMQGGPGNDTLDGGKGTDTLNGGAGKDTFIINRKDVDTIADFEAGEKIYLKGFPSDERQWKLMTTSSVLQIVDPDDEDNPITLANIANADRIDLADVMFMN